MLPLKNIDEEIFKELFHLHYDRMFANFLSKTKSAHIADDLTQTTFIKFWKYRSSYNANLSVEVQLYRKARQVFIDWLRGEAHQHKLAKELENLQPPVEFAKLELTDLLNKAIDQLSPMRKKVFLMSYVYGFSNKEISNELKISIRTVESHVLNAINRLRKLLVWCCLFFYFF